MELLILRCNPHNPLHLGSGLLDQSGAIIHSDTLFSALVNNYVLLFGQSGLSEFINAFKAESILEISSAFPAIETIRGELILFFPAPIDLRHRFKGDQDLDKSVKKIRFISEGILKEIGEGIHLPSCRMLGAEFLVTAAEHRLIAVGDKTNQPETLPPPIQFGTAAHVLMHQIGQEDAFFNVTAIYPRKLRRQEKMSAAFDTHYYFLFRTQNCQPELLARFKACVALLADEGIGGERSAGLGGFANVDWKGIVQFKYASKGDHSLSLGLGIPADQEAFDQVSKYATVMRGGNAIGTGNNNQFARKRIRMIAEGALCDAQPKGMTANIAGDDSLHQVLRYGHFFAIKIPKIQA